jgi:hypothetical protein
MFQAAGEHPAGMRFNAPGATTGRGLLPRSERLPRWVDRSKIRRAFEAARVAIERDDWARAIRSLQLVTRATRTWGGPALVEAYQRQGHLDLATRKVEEVITHKGAEGMPLQTCDQLAQRLEESGDFDRALEMLELIRDHDATWPNVATRIEGLRKRRSGNQQAVSGAPEPPASDPFGEAHLKCWRSSAGAGWESSSRPATAAWGVASPSSACRTACVTRRPWSSSCARRAPPPR